MKIENQEQLQDAFQELDSLIAEGFEGDIEKESEFRIIALAVEEYEDKVLKIMPLMPPSCMRTKLGRCE